MAEGTLHAALVRKSPRLQRVVDMLKKAEHPLSGMEIQMQAWVTNGSTACAEIRDPRNAAEGYMVSPATYWTGGALPWHDGNARYFLISAPGWTPRWTVTKEGVLLPYTEGHGAIGYRVQGTVDYEKLEMKKDEADLTPEPCTLTPAVRLCKFQLCRKPLPPAGPETQAFCNQGCKDGFWKLIREAGKKTMGV